MDKKIDLHTHSIFSDGHFSPIKLIDKAKGEDIDIISITDHDSINAYNYLEKHTSKIEKRIILIPGIEFTSKINNFEEIHILGYGINPNNSGILDVQHYIREKQKLRLDIFKNILCDFNLQKIADKLDKRKDLPYGLKNYNFYDFLFIYNVDETTIKQIKNQYKSAIQFLERVETDSTTILDVIHNANGYGFLAHPGHYKLDTHNSKNLIIELLNQGIDGIEIFHPENNIECQTMLASLCIDKNLLVSGGSDFHVRYHNLGYSNLLLKTYNRLIEKTSNILLDNNSFEV